MVKDKNSKLDWEEHLPHINEAQAVATLVGQNSRTCKILSLSDLLDSRLYPDNEQTSNVPVSFTIDINAYSSGHFKLTLIDCFGPVGATFTDSGFNSYRERAMLEGSYGVKPFAPGKRKCLNAKCIASNLWTVRHTVNLTSQAKKFQALRQQEEDYDWNLIGIVYEKYPQTVNIENADNITYKAGTVISPLRKLIDNPK